MNTKKLGFTLIELLVVVAILGILAAVGIRAYQGYVSSAKKKSAQNIMMQISLGQVEYYSDNGQYYATSTCKPDDKSSNQIEKNLLGGADSINEDVGYYMCAKKSTSDYEIVAEEIGNSSANKCRMTMPKSTKITFNTHC